MGGIAPLRAERQRRRTSFAAFVSVASFAAVMALAAPALASPAKVALVHDDKGDALQSRTLTRLRAELAAAGFEIVEVARKTDDTREAVEAEPSAPDVFATIIIAPRTSGAADIWIADRVTGKTVIRRIEEGARGGNDASAVLAVRAVELLQASLLEAAEPATQESPARLRPVPSDVSAWVETRRRPAESRFALQAGAGVLHSFGGVGPALLPVLGFSYRVSSDLAVGLRAAGPAIASDLDAPSGSISVRQELAWIDLVYDVPIAGSIVRPIALLALGAYHVDVIGAARNPYQGNADDLLAAMAQVGIGARVIASARVSFVADVRALIVGPKPVIRAAGEEVGTAGRPSFLGNAAVEVRF